MFAPLLAAVTIEEFLAYSPEMQISMYESLVRVYGTKYLPHWLLSVYCYALNFAGAEEMLAHAYPVLVEFATMYRSHISAEFFDFLLAEEDCRQAAHWFAAQDFELAA